jgi:putative ABC transport system permease protein
MVRALSWRSVRARKGRAALSGLGIVLGVALFFSVLSLSNTIVNTFENLFSSVYGETDLVVTGGANAQGTLAEPLLTKIQRIDGVSAAVPSVGSTMTRVAPGDAAPSQKDQVFVGGVRPGDPDLSGSHTVAGTTRQLGEGLALDSSWAKQNHIAVGDTVRFATNTGVHGLKVVGLFRFGSGVEFGGQGFGTVTLEHARRLFAVPRGYSQIDVKVGSTRSVEAVRREIERIAPRGAEVSTPSDIADSINSQIQSFNVILYFFAAMSLFVGGFLILNSFNMTVAQRLREIGMLRTLGASRRLIRRVIMLEATILGVVGALLGIAGGLLLTKLMVSLVSSVGFPMGAIAYPPAAFVIAPLLGIGATLLGALRPAIRASRIPPIQAVLVEHRARPLRIGRRLLVGSVLTVLGLLGVFTLAAASDATTPVILAGAFGVVFLFAGVILLGPVVVPPLVRAMAWPLGAVAPVEGRIASGSAQTNPTRTASTASGLMIGVALVAAIGTLGSSMIGTVSDDLDRQLKTDFTIQPRGAQGGPQSALAASALTQIRALPGVGEAAGVKVTYLTKGDAANLLVRGMDPAAYMRLTPPQLAPGAVPDVEQALADGAIVVPASFAEQKGLKVGDTLKLEGGRGSDRLKIAALSKGASAQEAPSVVASLDTLDRIFGIDGYSGVLVIAQSPAERAALGRRIDALLKDQYPAFESLSNEQIKQQIKSQVNQVFSIFYVIMAVAIIVSLLGVVNTLLMSVLERTREIGLLRAVGSSRWQVRRMIIAESLLITAAGAALGLVVGMALGWAFVRGISSGETHVEFHPPVAVIVAVAVLSVLAGLLAALPPARRAARMNVIESLSYE